VIAICGRDRKELVERALPAVRAIMPHELLVFARDPATNEYDTNWLLDQGADIVQGIFPELPEQPVTSRVTRLRAAQVGLAARHHERRIIFLDSDVLVGAGFPEELARLWALQQSGWGRCGALTLGNYAGYSNSVFQRSKHAEQRVSIRTHALGGCLIFPFSQQLHNTLLNCPEGTSWDTGISLEVAGSRILTSEQSHVRHLGLRSGMCATRGLHGLDWQNQTADLQEKD
jgi:hypothetical protein